MTQLKSLVLFLGLQFFSQAPTQVHAAAFPEYKFEGFPPLSVETPTSRTAASTRAAHYLNYGGETVGHGTSVGVSSLRPRATGKSVGIKHSGHGSVSVRPTATQAALTDYPVLSRFAPSVLNASGSPRVAEESVVKSNTTCSSTAQPSSSSPPLKGAYGHPKEGLATNSTAQVILIPSQVTQTPRWATTTSAPVSQAALKTSSETGSSAVYSSSSTPPPRKPYKFPLKGLTKNSTAPVNRIPSQGAHISHRASTTPASVPSQAALVPSQAAPVPSQAASVSSQVASASSHAVSKPSTKTGPNAVYSSGSTRPPRKAYKFLKGVTKNSTAQANWIPSQVTQISRWATTTSAPISSHDASKSFNETSSSVVYSSSSALPLARPYDFSLEDLTTDSITQANLISSQVTQTPRWITTTSAPTPSPITSKTSIETSSSVVYSSSPIPSPEGAYHFSLEDLELGSTAQDGLISS